MYVYKWSQNLMYKNNVYKQERKENIQSILTKPLKKKKKTTLLLTKMSNFPLKKDYFHNQNYFPFLSRMTKGMSVK